MSFFSRVGAAIQSLGSKDQPAPATIDHDSFTGSRFVLIAGAILALLWAPRFGIGADLIQLAFWLVIAYIASNTITRSIQIWVNGQIARDFQRLAYQDGKLDEIEARSLSDRHQAVK